MKMILSLLKFETADSVYCKTAAVYSLMDGTVQNLPAQNVVHGLAAYTSPGTWLEMWTCNPSLPPPESESVF